MAVHQSNMAANATVKPFIFQFSYYKAEILNRRYLCHMMKLQHNKYNTQLSMKRHSPHERNTSVQYHLNAVECV